MKRILPLLFLTFTFFSSYAQFFKNDEKKDKEKPDKKEKRKFYRYSNGLILGYERGLIDNLQIGSHLQWNKIRIKRPVKRALDSYVEYNFGHNILGFRMSYWERHGRLKFTYGAKAGINTDFKTSSFALTPTVGFRTLGFHAQIGYNVPINEPLYEMNKLFVSLNYFIPYHAKWYSKKGDKKKTLLKF